MSGIISYLAVDSLLFRLLAFLAAASLHDYVHALTASKLGDPTAREQGRLTLNPTAHIAPFGLLMVLFGPYGWTKPVPVDAEKFKGSPRLSTILTSLSGPLANLIVGLISWWLYFVVLAGYMSDSAISAFLLGFLQYMVIVNLLYAIIHLLPLYPLDGWNIIRAIFGKLNMQEQPSKNIWMLGGMFLTIALMALPFGQHLWSSVYLAVDRFISMLF
ncbi:site-2 protease family protein [Paenibacillus sp. N1-5-1-14]|uniref:site-2 protease family protein n=1 Tax=Paenibacillus radicibacter TaxID=2972488 RepID=UPI002159668B|nr:site-2 protease family protein [Paenibacillus radicibacter]MCR8642346.1 site-2 protease family protein [Paenibacillus radicibacter]